MADFDYEEYDDPNANHTKEELSKAKARIRSNKAHRRQKDKLNEVGELPPPTPEEFALRRIYELDYVKAHKDLFANSTGFKDFGADQINSIHMSRNLIYEGGRLVLAEPRGFVKTGRTCNHALLATLQGARRYVVILAESIEKGQEILEAIQAELTENEALAALYPAVCACFEHINNSPHKAPRQTYKGEYTNIRIGKDRVRFPIIPGEPCSGSILQVRSKDKARGLFTRIRSGPEKGKILRPDFVFLDDIQTDEDAENPNTVKKIVRRLKRSVLFGGSHSKRVSALMCCTPICENDVTSHFILNEVGWEVVLYKMMKQPPKNYNLWIEDYAKVLLDFKKEELGSRNKAAIKAMEFYKANRRTTENPNVELCMDEGSIMSWEWAFGWNEEPQVEVSALQHAMNFLIYEGAESFESECQCNVIVSRKDTEDLMASQKTIMDKIHTTPRNTCPVETRYITTHIDVNKALLTYATCASGELFTPHIIDYGTFPEQSGQRWIKDNIYNTLSRNYPDIPSEEPTFLVYTAVKDMLEKMSERTYLRADGVELVNNLITVDVGWGMMWADILRACRDCKCKSIVRPARGIGFTAKEKPMMDKNYAATTIKSYHCWQSPTEEHQMMLYMDINFMKTLIHKGFKTRYGMSGSFSLFPPDFFGQHALLAEHCHAESPKIDYFEKEDRSVVIWGGSGDNEYFDNLVGCAANLFMLGASLRKKIANTSMDMASYMNSLKVIKT